MSEANELPGRRREYHGTPLRRADLSTDPVEQFRSWFDAALESGTLDPNAMILSTTDSAGQPSGRVVLLKHFDQNGFVFFTNLNSRKASDLSANLRAALTFYWREFNRQVRIEGQAKQVSDEISNRYFSTRPKGSQIAALISDQSCPVRNRAELERDFEKAQRSFRDSAVPRPENWGGFRLEPDRIEFWQGQENRLHDRLVYQPDTRGGWSIIRLAP